MQYLHHYILVVKFLFQFLSYDKVIELFLKINILKKIWLVVAYIF